MPLSPDSQVNIVSLADSHETGVEEFEVYGFTHSSAVTLSQLPEDDKIGRELFEALQQWRDNRNSDALKERLWSILRLLSEAPKPSSG